MKRAAPVLMAVLLAACAASAPVRQLTWGEVSVRASLPVRAKVFYGREPQQFGELRVPDRPGALGPYQGRYPVAMLVHGGCWQDEYDLKYMGSLAKALDHLGVATWTIEYRRLGGGGGWPHTFTDVADAADKLRALAASYPLDLERTIVVGHSAGGQLALWLAGRPAFPPGLELYRMEPLPFSGVIGLAPITDLARYSVVPNCGESVKPLLGGGPDDFPERYAAVSPDQRLPIRVPQRLVAGELDPIVPVQMLEDYEESADNARDDVELEVVRGAGHFDLLTPDGAGWPAVEKAIRELLEPPALPVQ